MTDINESNKQIVDSVQTLSATSEEITARTDEALETSGTNVDHMGSFRERMRDIEETIKTLSTHMND